MEDLLFGDHRPVGQWCEIKKKKKRSRAERHAPDTSNNALDRQNAPAPVIQQPQPQPLIPEIVFPLPNMLEKKPKFPPANEEALAHCIRCQRFGSPNWQYIKYEDVKDQFQATPGFCALKANDLLPEVPHNSQPNAALRRFDLTCGAVVNGLIQNRMIFQDIMSQLPHNVKQVVGQAFVAADSKFRQNSDALLQYVCGRRQEAIQERRKLYKPSNKVLRDELYEIPPSESHLFDDAALTDFVEKMDGVDNIFTTEQNAKSAYYKRKAFKRRLINSRVGASYRARNDNDRNSSDQPRRRRRY